MNPDKDLPAPCPFETKRARASGPGSLAWRSRPARHRAGGARCHAGLTTAPPAALKASPCPPSWHARARPAWIVLAGRFLALAHPLRLGALPFAQA